METVLPSLVRGSVSGRPLHTRGLAARAHPLRLFAACKPYLEPHRRAGQRLTAVFGEAAEKEVGCFILGIKRKEGGPQANCGWGPSPGLLQKRGRTSTSHGCELCSLQAAPCAALT